MRVTPLIFLTIISTPAAAQTIGAVHRFVPVAENIVVAVPRYGGANSTIIINSDHVMVVDAQGTVAAATVLIKEISRLTPLPIKTVVNTHWHGDHHGGNVAFRMAFPGVEIIAHPRTISGIGELANQEIHGVAPHLRNMLRPAEAALASGRQDGKVMSAAAVAQLKSFLAEEVAFLENVPADFSYELPDRPLNRAEMYRDKGRVIEIFYAGRPAHTDGDIIVRLRNERVTVVGDLITVPYVVPRSGYPRSYSATLNDINSRFDGTIIPGHGLPGAHEELMSTMAEFLLAVAEFVDKRLERGAAADAIVSAAMTDPTLSGFGARIEWDAEGGMQLLNFESLLSMTIVRAIEEAGEG